MNSNLEVIVYEYLVERMVIGQIEKEDMLEPEWHRDVLRKAQEQDKFCKFAREQLEQVNEGENGIVYRREENVDKSMVPKVYVNKVLEDFHDSPLAGHQGQQKTLLNNKKRF
ncbi:hypothetical protein JTB14_027614 [Gonioctena quinquepunctata]|nr:hypothetical protein JTB14_027614 [Gonioctena quinquepunctata]